MNGHGPSKVVVLYKITNVKGEAGAYNAFELPGKGTVSLGDVKNHCRALSKLNSAGSNGYHWRVRVDDKVIDPKAAPKYSWWDIQDENARLPVKEVSFTELSQILAPPKRGSLADDSLSKGASSVTRSLGKALNKVAASVDGASSTAHHNNFPRVPIVMFKLLDVSKLYDEFSSAGAAAPFVGSSQPRRTAPAPVPVRQQVQPARQAPQMQPAQAPVPAARPQPRQAPAPAARRPAPRPTAQEGSLMDFGAAPAAQPSRPLRQTVPASFGSVLPTETRAEKLKKEYAQKNQNENRVWDDVDQRWVAVDTTNGAAANKSTASAPPGGNVESSKPKLAAVSLDKVNTAGKSAGVANAVNKRVNDMKQSQAKAVNEMREREAAKDKVESEEDSVRQRLEPQIKAWSEEHGKKKQLRALIANLDKVLWPGAQWKTINLGDLLDDRKVKLAFHKASRVVHPDKTISLGPEERFIAKRIFDALSQAKTEFDDSK